MDELGDVQMDVVEECTVDIDNETAISVVALLVPSNNSYWGERTQAWYAFFYLLIIIYSVLFLSFAITCILLLSKRHLAQRFRVRTFIAIDLALITLGLSRFFFLLLDPWGQIGFCIHYACVIFSRILSALAFPSLTASYTLVFLTLWISARLRLGRSWVQRLKVLIPLCCIHYVVALAVEIVLLVPIPGSIGVLILLVSCDAIFSTWGMIVCLLFLVAGLRLLKTLQETARKSSVICKDSPHMNRHDLIEKSKFEAKNLDNLKKRSLTTIRLKQQLKSQHKQALRKVTLITYVTVALGILYSVLNLVTLILVILSIFDGCPGELKGRQMPPEVWLMLRYIFFTIEICMALLLTYAINDFTPLIRLLTCQCKFSPAAVEDTDVPSSFTADKTRYALNQTPPIAGRNKRDDSSSLSSFSDMRYPEQEQEDKLDDSHFQTSTPKTISPLVVSFSQHDVFHEP
jgi:hypothetical protein